MICCCICCWRFCTSLTVSPSSCAFSSSFGPFAYTRRRHGEGSTGARPLRLKSLGWPDQPRLIPKLLIRGVLHIADSDLSIDPGPLHLGEIHAQLLGLTLGRLRGVGHFLPTLGGILGLLGGLASGVLGTLRSLASLIGGLTCRVLGLLGGTSSSVLSLLGRALGGILRSLCGPSRLVGNVTRGILSLPGRLTGGLLDALHGLVCHLAHGALVFPALLRTGVGLVAGVLDSLGGLRGGWDLQIQHTTVGTELQADQRP